MLLRVSVKLRTPSPSGTQRKKGACVQQPILNLDFCPTHLLIYPQINTFKTTLTLNTPIQGKSSCFIRSKAFLYLSYILFHKQASLML